MRISELLTRDAIILDLKATTKEKAIDELVDKLDSTGKLNNKLEFKKAILKREEQSTGIGRGIAIPHARTHSVKSSALAFGYSREGIEYGSLDGKPVHVFFMIAGKEGENDEHIETLSKLSRIFRNEDFKRKIFNIKSKKELIELIDNVDEIISMKKNSKAIKQKDSSKLVLAVTACPTGIAHTYIAADALKEKAKEMGVDIKVETNGSTGVKNRLTDKDIKEALAIIVAADKQIEMERFNGKKVIETSASQGIKNPEKLINKALSGDIAVYNYTKNGKKMISLGKEEKSRFYKHFMNGVSNMLPFAVGGGVLIAISFTFGIKAFDPNNASFHPIAKLLMDIGKGNVLVFMIPILAGFIGMSIADRLGFAPGVVGGFIAANNGAGFLGGLIAGFLGGYIVLSLKALCSKLPNSLEGIKTVLFYPVLGLFLTAIIMLFIIAPPIKSLNLAIQYWLNTMGTASKIILGMVLGGMMAIDTGGIINKIAFTFGIAMIYEGSFEPHAAIMAGGMVPPLGIAIATTIFRSKFTKAEREEGKNCYIKGVSFITEGVIPFVKADPKVVKTSITTGSAAAGAMSMMFNIGLPAPHGGVFVIPIVRGNPLLYLLAIIIGSLITALMIGTLKESIKNN